MNSLKKKIIKTMVFDKIKSYENNFDNFPAIKIFFEKFSDKSKFKNNIMFLLLIISFNKYFN